MIEENRYARRKNKRVDLLAKPYTLEIIRTRYLGKGFTLQELSKKYPDNIKRVTLEKRLQTLVRGDWLNKKKLTKQEKKIINKERSGKMYRYSFSKQSIIYLRKYGSFTNPEGRLMNPSRILIQKMFEELQKQSPKKDYSKKFAYITK